MLSEPVRAHTNLGGTRIKLPTALVSEEEVSGEQLFKTLFCNKKLCMHGFFQ